MDCVDFLNLRNEIWHCQNKHSSSHFLHTMIHEWFHNIHMDLIYKKFGYESNDSFLKQKYPSENSSSGVYKIQRQYCDEYRSFLDSYPWHRYYLAEHFGEYAVCSGSFVELFAEMMTKAVSKSLNKNLQTYKNPMDNIPRDLSKEIKKFLDEAIVTKS